ncbi:MAG TPA: DUF4221 family protein [Bacteroidetes bacterium]|nr:DUF4221 family protein [Bacteroidota bacterium]
MFLKLSNIFLVILLFTACTSIVKVENEMSGNLEASMGLVEIGERAFLLDDSTAPKPIYTQMFKNYNGAKYLTFLNKFNNSIYFYDYDSLQFVKKIVWPKNGPKGIGAATGYHVKSLDSIYIYNKSNIEIVLSNEKSMVLDRITLCGNRKDINWLFRYPQYDPRTVKPFIETAHELLLTGFYFGSIPESIVSDFKFTARLDFKTNGVAFSHTYPLSLYGFGYNWEGDLFTEVYSDLHPDGDKLILSFPVSHDLYIADLKTGEYQKTYAGSNFASTISSINKKLKRSSKNDLLLNIVVQDEYTAIKYDKYRNVYYRFLLKSIPVNIKSVDWKEKPIAVIIFDENFNYLGETVIGTGENWYWQNSFVTEEGLNIEYIDNDLEEKYLRFRIFVVQNL